MKFIAIALLYSIYVIRGFFYHVNNLEVVVVYAMSANGNGGNYAPLKQMLSDSESEDDRQVRDALRINFSPGCNNLDYNSGLQSTKNYSVSDMDDYNTNLNTVDSTTDNVSFLQSDMSNKMSFPRRCAFSASIVMCVFTVLIFLWGIPCSEVGSCASAEWQDKTTSWELPYDEIELSGAVQVVDGAIPNTKNLIFIYRGNHMKHEDKQRPDDNVNGVILIVGNSGKVGWYTREDRIPTEINCHLVDVNRDKQKDCIVSGSEALLAALNPLSGTYYWHKHKKDKDFGNIAAIDFPIVLKDVDKDKVNDLVTVATVLPNTNHNSLIIISGATGKIIGDPMTVDECSTVKLLSEPDRITYICKNDTSEAIRELSYPELYRKLLKLDQTSHIPLSTTVKKRVNLSLKKKNENTREIYTNGPGKLIVENIGECPNSCQVNLKLLLERNGTTNVSWEYPAHHVFAMKPSSFGFSNSIRGFVMKL